MDIFSNKFVKTVVGHFLNKLAKNKLGYDPDILVKDFAITKNSDSRRMTVRIEADLTLNELYLLNLIKKEESN